MKIKIKAELHRYKNNFPEIVLWDETNSSHVILCAELDDGVHNVEYHNKLGAALVGALYNTELDLDETGDPSRGRASVLRPEEEDEE